jgi:hypothetical protein
MSTLFIFGKVWQRNVWQWNNFKESFSMQITHMLPTLFLLRIPLPDIPLPSPACAMLRPAASLWLRLAALQCYTDEFRFFNKTFATKERKEHIGRSLYRLFFCDLCVPLRPFHLWLQSAALRPGVLATLRYLWDTTSGQTNSLPALQNPLNLSL